MASFAATLPKGLRVLDVGSFDVNGTYRDLFEGQEYVGMDIEAGKNVDVVQPSLYKFPFPDGHFDVVVSGNVMEHVEFLWLWALEVDRVLKAGGRMCHVTPHKIHYHPHPVDCWRVMKDGMACIWQGWMIESGRSPYLFEELRMEELDTFFVGKKAAQ